SREFGAGPEVSVRVLESVGDGLAQSYTSLAEQLFAEVKAVLAARPVGDVLLQVVLCGVTEHEPYTGLAGLLRVARHEAPKRTAPLLVVASEVGAPETFARMEGEARRGRGALRSLGRYTPEHRRVQTSGPLADTVGPTPPWGADGA